MSQTNNSKSTPPVNEKPTSHPPKEMNLEGVQKTETQKPQEFALPPEDKRLRHEKELLIKRELTFLEKAKIFLSRLFGK